MVSEMKVVLLCGGEGTRLKEETEFKPKPMVAIGGMPILWHIMKIYASYGFNDFILCLGYKGDYIKQFFLSHEVMANDITIQLNHRNLDIVHRGGAGEDWTITFAETGLKAQTGSRIKQIEKYIDSDNFLATYGDGLSDVKIPSVIDLHKKANATATVTAVHPHSKYGMITAGDGNLVRGFVEKPVLMDYVNGGYFVFKKDIFDYLDCRPDCILEQKPFTTLVGQRKMAMFAHEGFWHSMDTYKDFLDLNKMWDDGKRHWKVWGD